MKYFSKSRVILLNFYWTFTEFLWHKIQKKFSESLVVKKNKVCFIISQSLHKGRGLPNCLFVNILVYCLNENIVL